MRRFIDDETIDRLFDIFGNYATIGGTTEEAVEGVWPLSGLAAHLPTG